MKRVLSLILAAVTILLCGLSAISCDSTTDGNSETELSTRESSSSASLDNGFTITDDPPFFIVRSDSADRHYSTISIELRTAIEESYGFSPALKTDWDGKEDNSGRREILIGKTNRELSTTALEKIGYNQYSITVTDQYIAIVGYDDATTEMAVNYFIENYLTGDNKLTVLTSANNCLLTYVEEPNMKQDGVTYDFISNVIMTNEQNLDEAFLHYNSGNTTSAIRFADGNAELVYKFDISEMTEPTFDLSVYQNYLIEVSPDDSEYTTVFNYADVSGEPARDMSNNTIVTINPYDFNIVKNLYIKIRDNDSSDGWGGAVGSIAMNYYKPLNATGEKMYLKTEEDIQMAKELSTVVEPSEVVGYDIAEDGGLIYNPISREAEKAGTLHKYDNAEKLTAELETDGVKVTFSVPKNVTAYDAVPVEYTISNPNKKQKIHVGANAAQLAEKTGDNVYYDLNLPGTVDLEYEYLGYVAGYNNAGVRAKIMADFNDTQSTQYPHYNLSALMLSSEVEAADCHWFKFKYTNIGNTILDGDGNGTFCFAPILYVNEDGKWVQKATPENIYYRITEDLYPGESGEVWVTFKMVLPEGDLRITMNNIVRTETANPENYGVKIWGGHVYSSSTLDFTVKKDAAVVEPKLTKNKASKPARNTWLHTYEEFMSSYDTWIKMSDTNVTSTMYVQPAPWSDSITLKLLTGNSDNLVSVTLPVEIESDSLKIEFNPDNENYVILEDGTRFPAITAQSMADMRGNVQQGPDAAGNVINMLLDMQESGINLVTTTAAFEYDMSGGTGISDNIDAFWFSADVMREIGLTMEGAVTYPYESSGNISKATWIDYNRITALQQEGISNEKLLALSNGIKSVYQFQRWGDNYWIGGNDAIVLSVEDTRGWMRIDFNARLKMSDSLKNKFRIFLSELYGNIEAVNEAWGTDYASFDAIDPEEGTTDDHGWRQYKNGKAPFEEWSRATADLDIFRTYERVENYVDVITEIETAMPKTRLNLRTEGANWMAAVDPNTDNSHYRHVYYSQRRCAMIAEIMSGADVLYSHSDYTTLPYTPSEVAELTKASVESGIIPMLLPQFNRMRDIASNSKWGNDFSYEYNTTGNTKKGAYISTVCSVYTWYKATYENGGVPGILWQDHLCDGYATSTQMKEIAFFTKKLREALDTPEGKEWATNFENNSEEMLGGSKAVNSFNAEYIADLVAKYKAER
ncbi:MAG: hypothetical protein J6I45_03580 [Clostridia bacterium]|nr:hypothetical protein [Clostridia bacterium]